MDGKVLQNKNYFTSLSTNIFDADYKASKMAVLDNLGNVVIVDYIPDSDPDPDNNVNPQGGSIVWIIIVVGVIGIIGVIILLLFIFQEKIPAKYRQKLPEIFNKKKNKESLI